MQWPSLIASDEQMVEANIPLHLHHYFLCPFCILSNLHPHPSPSTSPSDGNGDGDKSPNWNRAIVSKLSWPTKIFEPFFLECTHISNCILLVLNYVVGLTHLSLFFAFWGFLETSDMLMFRFFVPLFFGRSFNFQSCQDVLLMLLVDPECSWWKDCRTSSYSTTQHANVMYSFGVFQNSADSSRVEFWTIIPKECLRGEIEAFVMNKLPVIHNLDKVNTPFNI